MIEKYIEEIKSKNFSSEDIKKIANEKNFIVIDSLIKIKLLNDIEYKFVINKENIILELFDGSEIFKVELKNLKDILETNDENFLVLEILNFNNEILNHIKNIHDLFITEASSETVADSSINNINTVPEFKRVDLQSNDSRVEPETSLEREEVNFINFFSNVLTAQERLLNENIITDTLFVNENEREVGTLSSLLAGSLTYSIDSSLDGSLFKIDSQTGSLEFIYEKDYEKDKYIYEVNVRVENEFGLTKEEIVKIKLLDISNQVQPNGNFNGTAFNDDIKEGNDNRNTFRGYEGNDRLSGGKGNDRIIGGNGDDIIFGNDGNDSLSGDNGDDIIHGYANNDRIWGGEGNDKLYGEEGNDNIQGDNGNDYISGGLNNDRIYGENGEDKLFGDEGNDKLYGGNQNDILYGGEGNDILQGQNQNDELYGGEGVDKLYGGNQDDILYGDEGNDKLYGGNQNDILYGGEGNDILQGQNHNDELYGGKGLDILYGGNHNDELYGEEGEDNLYGGNGRDNLYGGIGDDRLYGGGHTDRLYAGAGDDYLASQGWGDYIYGEEGNDTLEYYSRNKQTDGGVGEDTLQFNTTDGTNIRMYSSITNLIKNIETFDFELGKDNLLVRFLDVNKVRTMTDEDNRLELLGKSTQKIDLDMSNWQISIDTQSGYQVYEGISDNSVKLLIENDLQVI